jgi:membrane-bound lytic murein transglycosylase F
MNKQHYWIALSVITLFFAAALCRTTPAPSGEPTGGAAAPKQTAATPIASLAAAPATTPTALFPLYDADRIRLEATARRRVISEYDDVIRSVGMREGVDWRLMSAIAYHESRFKSHVVSSCGARGIMQIMPVVARHFNVPQDRVTDVEINVMLAAKLLKNIEQSMHLPATTPNDDRMSLILASYNAGVGNLADARRRARLSGLDANSWDNVAPLLARRQTDAFVRNVMERYSDYCMLARL